MQSEFVILLALKEIFLSQTNPSRTKAVVMLIAGTLILLAFENNGSCDIVNFKYLLWYLSNIFVIFFSVFGILA